MRALTAPITLLLAAAVGATVAVAPASTARTDTPDTIRLQRVMLEDATEAEIVVELDAGRIWFGGSSLAAGTVVEPTELLRGEFTFPGEAVPEISYSVVEPGGTGRLLIEPSANAPWSWSPSEQEWLLYVNPTVPTKLDVTIGTGDVELALGGMMLTEVAVESGAGDVTLDLTGDWRTSLEGTIDIGAGDLTIRAPRETGVKIVPIQGVGRVHGEAFAEYEGAYVNGAYGSTLTAIELTVHQGAGHIELTE